MVACVHVQCLTAIFLLFFFQERSELVEMEDEGERANTCCRRQCEYYIQGDTMLTAIRQSKSKIKARQRYMDTTVQYGTTCSISIDSASTRPSCFLLAEIATPTLTLTRAETKEIL